MIHCSKIKNPNSRPGRWGAHVHLRVSKHIKPSLRLSVLARVTSQVKKMKIAILGYGKMGRAIEGLAIEGGHEIVLKIDRDNRGELTQEALRKADVAIEFSRPESAFDNIRLCLEAGLPVVSGTTGWLDRIEEVKAICAREKGAFFYAPNFSIGVNLFFAMNRYLAALMEEQQTYDVKMEEVHHTQKLDAPSGTAIRLAEDLLNELSRKKKWVNQGSEDPEDLEITSRRIDDVPGTHEVTWTSTVDTMTIRHEAHSREGFARGALRAAEWLVGREGFFGMADLLGI